VLPGLALVVALAAAATWAARVLPGVSPLVAGVALGALVANVVALPDRLAPGVAIAARTLLRAGIVLLGLRLSLGDLAGLGADGLVVVAVVVAITFVGTQWLAARLGIGRDLGLLVATGYSICGASAIAAMDGVVEADEEETAYAITLVTLCGTLSIFVLPVIAELVGLTGAAFGTWVGGAVHDVGQVVATASHGDDAALEAATVVKLTRVVLLAPLVMLVALARRRAAAEGSAVAGSAVDATRRPPLLPLFVIGFLAAILVRSAGVLDGGSLSLAADAEKLLLTVALVGLGLGVRVDKMRRLGGRPLLLGVLAWVLVAGTAYVGTIAVS
jgi:uncharacterized integral membrane protein (TIGR00698 family)